MLDPVSANAALAVYKDMLGAANLKAKYKTIEYDEMEDDDEPSRGYYHFRLTNKDDSNIPQGRQVNVVRLEGVMMRDDTWCQYGTRTLASWLREADADKKVISHILLIDSGGGAADSVPDLADAIRDCEKPVIAFVDGYMCSAAMYAGSYCRHIVANRNNDMVGCIGTMIELCDFPAKATLEDGQVYVRIYADPSDEKNSDFEAALNGDFKPIRDNMLNPLANQFRIDVKANRPSVTDDQLHGRTYFASDVCGTLIDEIGDFSKAIEKSIQLSNINITAMKGFEHLQSIDSCRDLQSVDNVVTLSMEQITDIDNRIAQGDEIATVRQQLNAANDTVKQISQERDDLKSEIALKDSRIAELNEKIANAGVNNPVATATHNGDPAKTDEEKEMTDEEAMQYCLNHIKKHR